MALDCGGNGVGTLIGQWLEEGETFLNLVGGKNGTRKPVGGPSSKLHQGKLVKTGSRTMAVQSDPVQEHLAEEPGRYKTSPPSAGQALCPRTKECLCLIYRDHHLLAQGCSPGSRQFFLSAK